MQPKAKLSGFVCGTIDFLAYAHKVQPKKGTFVCLFVCLFAIGHFYWGCYGM